MPRQESVLQRGVSRTRKRGGLLVPSHVIQPRVTARVQGELALELPVHVRRLRLEARNPRRDPAKQRGCCKKFQIISKKSVQR